MMWPSRVGVCRLELRKIRRNGAKPHECGLAGSRFHRKCRKTNFIEVWKFKLVPCNILRAWSLSFITFGSFFLAMKHVWKQFIAWHNCSSLVHVVAWNSSLWP